VAVEKQIGGGKRTNRGKKLKGKREGEEDPSKGRKKGIQKRGGTTCENIAGLSIRDSMGSEIPREWEKVAIGQLGEGDGLP